MSRGWIGIPNSGNQPDLNSAIPGPTPPRTRPFHSESGEGIEMGTITTFVGRISPIFSWALVNKLCINHTTRRNFETLGNQPPSIHAWTGAEDYRQATSKLLCPDSIATAGDQDSGRGNSFRLPVFRCFRMEVPRWPPPGLNRHHAKIRAVVPNGESVSDRIHSTNHRRTIHLP